jgi:hypothetical protein
MAYTVENSSCGMMYIPSLMTIGSSIPVILTALPQQLTSHSTGTSITDERYL